MPHTRRVRGRALGFNAMNLTQKLEYNRLLNAPLRDQDSVQARGRDAEVELRCKIERHERFGDRYDLNVLGELEEFRRQQLVLWDAFRLASRTRVQRMRNRRYTKQLL